MIIQIPMLVPPELEAGLLSGELIRNGGVVRNRLGQIVKELKEVAAPLAEEKTAGRVAGVFKSSRIFKLTLVASAVGAGSVAVVRKWNNSGEAEVPECVRDL